MPTHEIHPFSHTAAHTCLALVCALLWQTSGAQTPLSTAAASAAAGPHDSAANPVAKVPTVVYRSVFKETSLGVEKDTDNWRKANDEVGKFTRGHVDILKWEEQEAAKAMKEPPKAAMPAPASRMPAAPSTPKPIAAPAHKH
jgi:hypothetical protein